ncbi:unnamed protein product [Prunus brigantina]
MKKKNIQTWEERDGSAARHSRACKAFEKSFNAGIPWSIQFQLGPQEHALPFSGNKASGGGHLQGRAEGQTPATSKLFPARGGAAAPLCASVDPPVNGG